MIRDLAYYGDEILRIKSALVETITGEIRQLAQDLIETAFEHDAAGLSAPQIGASVRIFVTRYDNGMDREGMPILCPPKIFINPELSLPSEEMWTHGEGCLSIPGIYEEVSRPFKVHVEAIDLQGNKISEDATGWRARNLMHENDHLNGVLFIDRIDPKKKMKIKQALQNLKKRYNHPHR